MLAKLRSIWDKWPRLAGWDVMAYELFFLAGICLGVGDERVPGAVNAGRAALVFGVILAYVVRRSSAGKHRDAHRLVSLWHRARGWSQ